jgi:hypothetical protein
VLAGDATASWAADIGRIGAVALLADGAITAQIAA